MPKKYIDSLPVGGNFDRGRPICRRHTPRPVKRFGGGTNDSHSPQRSIVIAVAAAILAVWTSSSFAVTTTYTSSSDFFTALGGAPSVTEGYEGLTINSLISEGSTLNGITYDDFPDGTEGRIDDLYNRFGDASLALQRGSDDTSFFFGGEEFTVTFPGRVRAVGIFFNIGTSPEGSLTVASPLGTAGNGAAYDTDTFYFVGLISSNYSATSATFRGSTDITSGFNVDDLTYLLVPEPASAVLMAAGLATLAAASRRRAGR